MRVARIFNTYGPRMHMFDGEPLHIQVKYRCVLLTLLCVHGGLHAGRVVSNFIMQALQGKPLTVSCVKEVHWRGRGEEEGGGRSEGRGEEGRREKIACVHYIVHGTYLHRG